jgi:hypothetical protein
MISLAVYIVQSALNHQLYKTFRFKAVPAYDFKNIIEEATTYTAILLINNCNQVLTQNFYWGGEADPEAIYNLCLILKIML